MKKGIKIILIVVVVLLLVLLAFLFFNPKIRFLSNTNKLVLQMTNILNTDNKINTLAQTNTTELTSDVVLNVNDESGVYSVFDNTSLKLKYNNDSKNKKAYVELSGNILETEIPSMMAYFNQDKLYFKVMDVFDKYYSTDYAYVDTFDTTNVDDLDYIIDIFTKSVYKGISSSDFKTSRVKEKIGAKTYSLTKSSLIITTDMVKDIELNFFEEIKDNNKALEILTKYLDKDKDEVIKTINDSISSLNADKTESTEVMTYNTYYTFFNKVLKYEIISNGSSIILSNYINTTEVIVSENGFESLNFTVVKKGNIYNIIGDIGAWTSFSGTYTTEGLTKELNINVISDATDPINILLKNTTTELIKNKKFLISNSLKISSGINNITLSLGTNIEFGKSIPIINISNAKDINNITAEEQDAIALKLQELPIYALFEALLGSSTIVE